MSALRACFLKTFLLARDRYYAYVSTYCGILHTANIVEYHGLRERATVDQNFHFTEAATRGSPFRLKIIFIPKLFNSFKKDLFASCMLHNE